MEDHDGWKEEEEKEKNGTQDSDKLERGMGERWEGRENRGVGEEKVCDEVNVCHEPGMEPAVIEKRGIVVGEIVVEQDGIEKKMVQREGGEREEREKVERIAGREGKVEGVGGEGGMTKQVDAHELARFAMPIRQATQYAHSACAKGHSDSYGGARPKQNNHASSKKEQEMGAISKAVKTGVGEGERREERRGEGESKKAKGGQLKTTAKKGPNETGSGQSTLDRHFMGGGGGREGGGGRRRENSNDREGGQGSESGISSRLRSQSLNSTERQGK